MEDDEEELQEAARHGNLATVHAVLESGVHADAATLEEDRTALILAATYGHLDVVRYLVALGADKEATTHEGMTVLMHTARRGHLDVVRYLVERGVDVEAKDARSACTALLHAAGHLNVVKYLVEQGADKEAKDKEGRTALMKVSHRGDKALTKRPGRTRA